MKGSALWRVRWNRGFANRGGADAGTVARRGCWVKVKAAGINPGEAKIRQGLLHSRWPATFPSGEGSDLAGIVTKVGSGSERFQGRRRSARFHRPARQPRRVCRRRGQKLGQQAHEGIVGSRRARCPSPAAPRMRRCARSACAKAMSWQYQPPRGGVGSIAVQLAARAGAKVIAIASPANHDWLAAHGAKPEPYGTDLLDRLRPAKVDAFIDAHGSGYVKLAIELGVEPKRIDTIIDFAAAGEYGVKSDGSSSALNASVLSELATLIAAGELEIPIAATFPLAQIREAFSQLETGHIRGKIVLLP